MIIEFLKKGVVNGIFLFLTFLGLILFRFFLKKEQKKYL